MESVNKRRYEELYKIALEEKNLGIALEVADRLANSSGEENTAKE